MRILKNAFVSNRIAHALILTGVRGVGKTTTARLIAKGLNCVGPDGKGEPTTEPCGECDNCVSITNSMHIDVVEMDAASRTGVDDIRDIIENVSYRAVSSRYRIFIIDEVHMLSKNAFNALLKTLEEPPAHVKFIFATTEIRMVPVTVLSRCQRFDLRRIEPAQMAELLAKIANIEKVDVSEEALSLIIRAAEGSARDATSLLDQAISLGQGQVQADQVREMLGLADRGRILDLFDLIMKGDAAGALKELASQYSDGVDPQSALRDLAEAAHWLSVVKIEPDAAKDPAISPDERTRGQKMARELPIRALSRSWQMLLNSLEGLAIAPNAMSAAEMAVIRLTHVANLPTSEELIRRLDSLPAAQKPEIGSGVASHAERAQDTSGSTQPEASDTSFEPVSNESVPVVNETCRNLVDVVDMLKKNDELQLAADVEERMKIVQFGTDEIVFDNFGGNATDLVDKLRQSLSKITKRAWSVRVVSQEEEAKSDEMPQELTAGGQESLMKHKLTQSVLKAFPGSKVEIGDNALPD